MKNNTIIYKKVGIKGFDKEMFNYMSLGEIVGQNFLNSIKEDTDLSININIVKNPKEFMSGKSEKFSEYYDIGKGFIYYARKYAGINIQLLIKNLDSDNISFYFNKQYYNLIRFKIDNLYPVGVHITDVLLLKLIEKGNLVVHGASIYNENTNGGFSLIAPPDTGKTYTTYKFLETEGFKFLGEDLSLWDSKDNNLYCMPYTSTWEHRFNLSKINLGKIPFLGLFIDRKKYSVYDIFGESKVQKKGESKQIYLLEKSNSEELVEKVKEKDIPNILRKVKIIQRNEFSYYKNPLLLAYDYINNIGLENIVKKENDLIDSYFKQNDIYIVKATDYKNYFHLIKKHQNDL